MEVKKSNFYIETLYVKLVILTKVDIICHKEYDEETTKKFIITYFTYCDIFIETENIKPDIRSKLVEVLEKVF